MTTINPFSNGANLEDDAREDSGAVSFTVGSFALFTQATDDWVAFRMRNVQIPQGSTIDAAVLNIRLGKSVAQTETWDFTWYGEDVDNAAAFGTVANDISSRTRTTASVNFDNLPGGYSVAELNERYELGDVSSIIQEIVNRPGWVAGNSMVLMANPNGGGDAFTNLTFGFATAGNHTAGPRMTITYAALGPPNMGGTFWTGGELVANREIIRNVTAFS